MDTRIIVVRVFFIYIEAIAFYYVDMLYCFNVQYYENHVLFVFINAIRKGNWK